LHKLFTSIAILDRR